MSDAALFVAFFGGFFILRFIVTMVFFLALLPRTQSCPNCDRPTVRVESLLFDRLLKGFRRSWCLTCGWHGLLRQSPPHRPARSDQLSPSIGRRRAHPARRDTT